MIQNKAINPLNSSTLSIAGIWRSLATPANSSRVGFAADQKLSGLQGSRIRILSFQASGYTDVISSDISKAIVGGTTGDTGTLLSYDNTLRMWWVLGDDSGDIFDISENITITSGTGEGTTHGASEQGFVPEKIDTIDTSLTLSQTGTTVNGTYSDAQGITCSVSGTYTPSTRIISLTGSCDDWNISITVTFNGLTLSGTNPTGGITVTRDTGGNSSENRNWVAIRATAVSTVGIHYYVDSEAGDDGNAGTSASAPKETITGLPSLNDNDTIHLARGSLWRESINEPSKVLSVLSYGVGPRPVLDGTVVVSAGSWSPEGSANVYEADVIIEDTITNGGGMIQMQDGIPLVPVANIAACSALSGSYVEVENPTAGLLTVYIHRRGGGAPVGDEQEVAVRVTCRLLGSTSIARNLMFHGSLDGSGGIAVTENDANDAPTINDCWSVSMTKHHYFACGGTLSRCVAFGWVTPSYTTGSAFVANRNVGSDVQLTYEDWAVIQWSDLETHASGTSAFLCHTNVSGNFGSITIGGCGTAHITAANGQGNVSDVTYTNCMFEKPRGAIQNWLQPGTSELSVLSSRFYTTDIANDAAVGICNSQGVTTFIDSIFAGRDKTRFICHNLSLVRCINKFSGDGSSAARRVYDDKSASSTNVSASYSVFPGQIAYLYLCNSVSGTIIQSTSDWNVSAGSSQVVRYSGDTIRTFVSYIALGETDQNSYTASDPTYVSGTDTGDRPTFIETQASETSRGFAAGPLLSQPGEDGWTNPVTYSEVLQYRDSLN